MHWHERNSPIASRVGEIVRSCC